MAKPYDVIIVGAGMVGALSAILLAKSSLRVALIDKHDGAYTLSTPPAYDARVSAISSQSKALLESANVWQNISQGRIASYDNIVVWDGLGSGYIDFNAGSAAMSELGDLVENTVLSHQMMKQIQSNQNIDLYFDNALASYELSENGAKVDLVSGQQMVVVPNFVQKMILKQLSGITDILPLPRPLKLTNLIIIRHGKVLVKKVFWHFCLCLLLVIGTLCQLFGVFLLKRRVF